jgi:hypothetical protein
MVYRHKNRRDLLIELSGPFFQERKVGKLSRALLELVNVELDGTVVVVVFAADKVRPVNPLS